VAAGAACLAGIGTVGTLWVTFRLLRSQVEDRRAEQARLVNAWASYAYGYHRDREDEVTQCDVYVRNGSTRPVYEVRVAVLPWEWSRDQPEAGIGRVFATIPPEQTQNPQDFSQLFPPPLVTAGHVSPPIQLTFTDSSGREWCRWPDGLLQDLGVIHRR
jgi:hypothetical protein